MKPYKNIENFQTIVEKIFPGAKLLATSSMEGGISAQITLLDIRLASNNKQKLVVRQYGQANLAADPHIAMHERDLLKILRSNNLPVPESFYADESGKILSTPYLVVSFIAGKTIEEPVNLIDFVRQMAEFLAKLHSYTVNTDITFLQNQADIATKRIKNAPPRLDDSLSEGRIRNALTKIWPIKQVNEPAVLHGDFWPGNTLWNDNKLVGVIDWEDALIGDPLADLANARLELLMHFGPEVNDNFTNYYKELMPNLDYSNLSYWDLYSALKPAGRMADWGLDNTTLHKLQAGHKIFVDRAIDELAVN